MLLCAATVALTGCCQKCQENDEPTLTPTEGDVLIKFYTCDSLLKYCDYTITCISDTSIDCSDFTIHRPDLTTTDSADWKAITDVLILCPEIDVTINNTLLITKTMHLKRGNHKFKIHFTRNTTPFASAGLDLLKGGSYRCIAEGLFWNSMFDPDVQGGVDTSKFDTYLSIVNDYVITISF